MNAEDIRQLLNEAITCGKKVLFRRRTDPYYSTREDEWRPRYLTGTDYPDFLNYEWKVAPEEPQIPQEIYVFFCIDHSASLKSGCCCNQIKKRYRLK